MTMNFWEAQRRARSRTTLYVTLFIILTIMVSVMIEIAMRYLVPEDYNTRNFPLPLAGLAFALITFGVAGFQYWSFSAFGGSSVAKSLGAYEIHRDTRDPRERQLLNIVEEMAVAASLPMPPVYVLPAKQINAFAAGLSPKSACITVTEGTLYTLKRDELQGVIAHEFGHVYNGDMKISMRLAAMVMGFFFVLYIGLRLIQFVSYRRDDKKGNPLMILALLFIAGGCITWFFGSILKAAVSREREYLADACAVQFTRNPDGIAGALKKIAKSKISDMPAYGAAFSHMYFDDKTPFSGLFDTHPPIEKRIEAIQGNRYDLSDLNDRDDNSK